jgi:UDP:flavonoid glycosyltransferase YjiC (YdhE family)
MEYQQSLKDKKILFATTPAAGHFNPLTGLAKYLKEAGSDVRWYTTSDFEKSISEMAITHYPFKKALNVNFNNLDAFFSERAALKSPVARMNFDMINLFGNRAEEYFTDMQEIFKIFPYDLVICDNTFSVVPLITEVLHIPVVVVGVMPLAEISRDLGPYGLGILHRPYGHRIYTSPNSRLTSNE